MRYIFEDYDLVISANESCCGGGSVTATRIMFKRPRVMRPAGGRGARNPRSRRTSRRFGPEHAKPHVSALGR
jgi:hypothetical protein